MQRKWSYDISCTSSCTSSSRSRQAVAFLPFLFLMPKRPDSILTLQSKCSKIEINFIQRQHTRDIRVHSMVSRGTHFLIFTGLRLCTSSTDTHCPRWQSRFAGSDNGFCKSPNWYCHYKALAHSNSRIHKVGLSKQVIAYSGSGEALHTCILVELLALDTSGMQPIDGPLGVSYQADFPVRVICISVM